MTEVQGAAHDHATAPRGPAVPPRCGRPPSKPS